MKKPDYPMTNARVHKASGSLPPYMTLEPMELAVFRFVRISAITPADKSALRFDKVQGIQAKMNKKT